MKKQEEELEKGNKKLKWTALKVGDVIRSKDGNTTAIVLIVEDRSVYEKHIYAGDERFEWFDDEKLAEWEKVEK